MKKEIPKNKMKTIDIGEPMVLYKTVNGEITNKGWCLMYYKLWLVKSKYSVNTITTYCQCIKTFLKPFSYSRTVITSNEIEDFLEGMTNLYFSAIKNFLKYIAIEYNKKFIHINYPRVHKPEKRVVKILDKREINLIIKDLPNEYKFFTSFLHHFALRISEIFRLQVNSIEWENWKHDKSQYGIMIIKKTKGKKERSMPINPEMMLKIYNHVKDRDGKVLQESYLFDFKFEKWHKKKYRKMKKLGVGIVLNLSDKKLEEYRNNILWIKFIKKSAGWYETIFNKSSQKVLNKSSYPHILRASKLTELLDRGLPIIYCRDYAGHASIITTEMYLSSNVKKLIENIKTIENEEKDNEAS